jgi:hypothetical protein
MIGELKKMLENKKVEKKMLENKNNKRKKNKQREHEGSEEVRQPAQSFPTPCYPEKPAGLPHCQMPAPNLLGRHRPTGEQISCAVPPQPPLG